MQRCCCVRGIPKHAKVLKTCETRAFCQTGLGSPLRACSVVSRDRLGWPRGGTESPMQGADFILQHHPNRPTGSRTGGVQSCSANSRAGKKVFSPFVTGREIQGMDPILMFREGQSRPAPPRLHKTPGTRKGPKFRKNFVVFRIFLLQVVVRWS